MKCLKCDEDATFGNYCEKHKPICNRTIPMGSVYINGFWLFVLAVLAVTTALMYIFNL